MKTDSEIQKNVMDELKWEPILNPSEIGVAVHNGVVTLSGYVDNYAKKIAAENAAWRVKGVQAVAEELEVRFLAGEKLPDNEIAENIVRTLKWHTTIPDEQIRVKVTEGWVYLEGEVDWNFQKEAAFNAIRFLQGVKGVSNLIVVKPRVNTNVVKDNIRKALERNADFEANNIKVETLGNKVILKGKTRSRVEKNSAERAAWSAPGVMAVEDLLVIDYN
ncbi:BON domain-containing protein [Mucilaginibacter gotjawali]|uniref:Osmotically-inducible protein OsmY n=2 Tax=Mucilaginibacter gotjawali TaxID=1550579 RepID=A0A839SFM8_9SPHI|nr:BON domain-containing protein [Mucilaginibacter gotjawali]MBB3056358.1 osmotically-inducible protein OsmY [Mucilaginibacter gotjawali]BAU55063.1 Osmotically-inducible protein Y precursor [Mucilaginibacter gotjawali]